MFNIGQYYNNQFFYLHTPEKIYDVDIDECGSHIEEHIFTEIDNEDISEEMAEIINNVANYENLGKDSNKNINFNIYSLIF